MYKLLIKTLICLVIFFNFQNKLNALSGIGPVKFNNNSMNNFFSYLRGDGNPTGEVGIRKGTPLSFAVNPEGTSSFYYYCPLKFGSDCNAADAQAVRECTKISKKNGGSKCKLFARGYRIVWGGTNIKLSRKFDEQVVRSVFKQNGWYTGGSDGYSANLGDKYIIKVRHAETNEEFKAMSSKEDYAKELAMENCQSKFKSGCYLYSVKHKGKTKTFAKTEDTNEDTVKKLQDIKNMLDEGLITESEFKKLKKEIFN